MKRMIYIFLFCEFFLLAMGKGLAEDSASHQVTVCVAPISEVAITGGDVSLTIDQHTGNGTLQSLPDSSTGLIWETNEADRKITVATNISEPAYPLSVEALSVTGSSDAMPAGLVTVSSESRDLLDDIDQGAGSCTLVYTVAADIASGGQPETHTITYTITSN